MIMIISSNEHKDTKNLSIVWVNNKKAYDIVQQSWMINCLKIYKISDEVQKFIKNTFENESRTWVYSTEMGYHHFYF